MDSPILTALANHLWQSTLFAMIAGGLTLLLRENSARVRYSLWLAASAKFLVPFALLSAVGAHIPWPLGPARTGLSALSFAGQMATQFSQFGGGAAAALAQAAHVDTERESVAIAIGAVWTLGTLMVGARWFFRWLLVHRSLRESTESRLAFVIPVRSSLSQLEPGVVGVLHPVLVLPRDMEQRLTAEEMHAVLAHERCHVAWRDNLAAALHMLVEALFWFHPLIWWLGTRLVAERERACDEQVLADGHPREIYAEGILKVCEHYLEARLACVAGVGGANLRQRIEAILKAKLIERLSGARKLVLALAAGAALALPIAVGVLTAPHVRAQEGAPTTDEPQFRNVSVRLAPADPGILIKFSYGGRFHYRTLRQFISDAYGVADSQIVGRDWTKESGYDITADSPPVPPFDPKYAVMIRALLAKRFGLVVRRERRQMDGYVLRISPGGSKLTPRGVDREWIRFTSGFIDAKSSSLGFLTTFLRHALVAPVVDRTGLRGSYDYKVTWNRPLAASPDEPTAVAKALEDQLGLQLEARRLTVEVINVLSLKSPKETVTGEAAALNQVAQLTAARR